MSIGSARTLLRLAPWGLSFVAAWLLDLLFKQSRQALPAYGELDDRLDRVELTLDRLAVASPPPGGAEASDATTSAMPRAIPTLEGSPETIVYRSVSLKHGVQFQVAVDPWRQDPIIQAVVTGETWFLDDYSVLLDQAKPGDRVLDLGGHVGTFALAAAALGCRVLCLEAAPDNLALLRASVARNGFDQLEVIHAAATDHTGSLQFFPNGPWGTIANPAVLRSPAMIQAHQLAPVQVPALTVDGLLEKLGWDGVDLVKMDIEGSELAALRGMANLLSRPDGPLLLYESNAHALAFFGQTTASLDAALQQLGFSTYLLEGGRLVPTQPDDFRVECTVNCLAVKGGPLALAGWPVTAPRTTEQTIGRIISEFQSPRPFDRAYLGQVLARADATVLADPRVQLVLSLLRNDPDETARLAAAWSRSADRRATGADGR